MKHLLLLPLLLALFVTGCVETHYVWSPDGKWMTVISKQGLQLADPDGNLQPATVYGISIASWFPDSKRLLACRDIDVKTWDELTKYLSPQQTQDVIYAAGRAGSALAAYNWTAPDASDWDHFTKSFMETEKRDHRDTQIFQSMPAAIGMYMRDHADPTLRQSIPDDRWKELTDLTQGVHFAQVYIADGANLQPGPVLLTSESDIYELRLSPTGNAAIIVAKGYQDHLCDLWVAATAGGQPAVKVSEQAAWFPDWSADGKDVLFVRSAGTAAGDAAQVGSLSRCTVMGDDGTVLQTLDAPKDLVGLLYSELTRVRCLKDGRILFSTAEVTLPTTAGDLPKGAKLFALEPGNQGTVTRLLSADAYNQLGDAAQYFEPSPDGTKLSIPDTQGKVSIVDLRSGAVTNVQNQPVRSGDQDKTLLTVPQWRSNDEITFVAPDASGNPGVVLWSISAGKGKPLSGTWPAGTVEDKPAPPPANGL